MTVRALTWKREAHLIIPLKVAAPTLRNSPLGARTGALHTSSSEPAEPEL